MPKTRTTLTIDANLLHAIKVRAARTGKDENEVIEASLRRDLGFELLDRLWSANDMTHEEVVQLAVEARLATR